METIHFFEIEKWGQDYISKALVDHTLHFHSEALTADNIPATQNATILSPFIYSTLKGEVLSNLPTVRYIATRSTGFDHIDLEYCRSKNIVVSNVPTYGVNTIAEHTFTLILALSRNLIQSVENTRKDDFGLEGLRGFELAGKKLGVIGFGHIAKRVIEIAKGFHMNIQVYTRHADEAAAKQWGITFVDLPTLLSTSDIVSVNVPLTSETHHMINKENILHMKKGSYLINTARGAIVETEAIVLALEKEILTGAGLDVLEEECNLREERELLSKEFLLKCDLKTQLLNHVLLNKPNVIITPHNAFNSHEALQQILDVTIENIKNFINNSPSNTV